LAVIPAPWAANRYYRADGGNKNATQEVPVLGEIWQKMSRSGKYRIIGVWVVVALLGIGYLVIKVMYPTNAAQNTPGNASTSAKLPANLKWVEHTDPKTGYKWAVAVTSIVIKTQPDSPSDNAIPQGQGYIVAHIAIQNRTNGAISVPDQWYFGLKQNSGYTGWCGQYANQTAPANYCWSYEKSFIRDGGSEKETPIQINGADPSGTYYVPSTTNPRDVILGDSYGSQANSTVELPQP
jgi:hypothetical protein